MTTIVKTKRQTDPDVQRIRQVKEAAAKLAAAKTALIKARDRQSAASAKVDDLIANAPPAQQNYLRSLIGLSTDEDEE